MLSFRFERMAYFCFVSDSVAFVSLSSDLSESIVVWRFSITLEVPEVGWWDAMAVCGVWGVGCAVDVSIWLALGRSVQEGCSRCPYIHMSAECRAERGTQREDSYALMRRVTRPGQREADPSTHTQTQTRT